MKVTVTLNTDRYTWARELGAEWVIKQATNALHEALFDAGDAANNGRGIKEVLVNTADGEVELGVAIVTLDPPLPPLSIEEDDNDGYGPLGRKLGFK